jgi:hypothetical protein
VKRLAASLPALLIALLCSACGGTTGANPEKTVPTGENRTPSQGPASAEPTTQSPSPSPTLIERQSRQEPLPFGKSYSWDDGVAVTVGKPKKFTPSEFAVVEKSKRYVRFTVTVVNKSKTPIDLGLTYISVQSGKQEADHVFDSPTGLNGPPDKKVIKGKEAEFDVGFGVADPKDMVMEVALHDNRERSSLLYST